MQLILQILLVLRLQVPDNLEYIIQGWRFHQNTQVARHIEAPQTHANSLDGLPIFHVSRSSRWAWEFSQGPLADVVQVQVPAAAFFPVNASGAPQWIIFGSLIGADAKRKFVVVAHQGIQVPRRRILCQRLGGARWSQQLGHQTFDPHPIFHIRHEREVASLLGEAVHPDGRFGIFGIWHGLLLLVDGWQSHWEMTSFRV